MFYEELFELDDEYDTRSRKYTSGFSAISELKQEKKFYRLYSAITECHVIMIKNQMYEHMQFPHQSMVPSFL